MNSTVFGLLIAKGRILRVIAVLFGFVAFTSLTCGANAAGELTPLEIAKQDGSTSQFLVEFADTDQKRAQGLMFRRFLASDRGMLFDFGSPREVQMWMKNTFISLDMVFIRADGVIHRIEQNTEPHSLKVISSRGLVQGVLELPAGTSRRLSLRAGDRVGHVMFGEN